MSHRTFSPTGGLRELVLLFLPILGITFSNFLFVLIEKVLLARISESDFNAAVNAAYAWQIFQGSTVSLALMAQVFAGRYWGAKDLKSIGPCIWQFIWFSLFSNCVTIPVGILYGTFYFHNTEIEGKVMSYYTFLLCLNFLFPLAASLISFYIAQGKVRLVFCSTIATQLIKVCLAYVLILGWEGILSPLGLTGGVISTLVSQGGLCLILLAVFLNRKNQALFNSHCWHFDFKSFWRYINPGLMRAICRILTFLCWATVAHLMTARGGDYLLVLSVGGTIFLFLPFVTDALFQAQTSVAAHILGSGNRHLLQKAFRSGTALVLILSGIFAIPFLLFPLATFATLFPEIYFDDVIVKKVFLGVWVSFAFFSFVFIPVSHILVLDDARFTLIMGLINWINGYAFMYFAIEGWKISAEDFWIALSVMHGTNALLYYLRVRWLHGKRTTEAVRSLRKV